MLRPLNCCASIVALLAFFAGASHAAVIYNGGTYTENFNGTIADATSVTGPFSSTIGVQAPIPAGSTGSSGWDGVKRAGTSATAMNFSVDNGALISGALYSYGSTASGNASPDTERALGALSSGSNAPAFGVALVNNTAATIDSVSINFTAEFWRNSTSSTSTPNTLTFGYEVGAAGSSTYLTSATALPTTSLDIVGPPTVASNVALNGNDPANQSARSGILSGLNWGIGQSLYLRWQDVDDQGSDAGLAVDNFSLSVVPEPMSAVLMLISCVVGMPFFRRAR